MGEKIIEGFLETVNFQCVSIAVLVLILAKYKIIFISVIIVVFDIAMFFC